MFPAGLLERAQPADDRAWWLLHTRPRQEKSLARNLFAAQVPFYLPLARRQGQMRNRVINSYLPLFPSYVFLRATQDERLLALSSSRVVGSIRVSDQERLICDLTQIDRLIRLGTPIAAEDRMVPGATVEIQYGPLAGLRGKIVQGATRNRFVVAVDFIQRGASILLDGDSLMPIRS